MDFSKINADDIAELKRICGEEHVLTDAETKEDYSHDYTEDLRYAPEVVVLPATTAEVSAVMKLCHNRNFPVYPVGGRTGLSGGMLAVYGGVALGLARMNRIIEIDTRNFQAVVEPGVITQHFQEEVEKHGLYYPPDPASRGSCFIGGNLAECSGGPHALKYGITRDYVLALEAVLPDGEIINTGARVLKNSTGYNLTQLLIGSEGTLAVITQVIFKLIPKPQHAVSMLVPFGTAAAACAAVNRVFLAGITPAAMEFMEKEAIDFGQKYLGEAIFDTSGVGAHLLIEVDGNDMDVIMDECEKIANVMEESGAQEILFAETAEQQQRIWRVRRVIGEAVKAQSAYKEEDTVVPRAELPALIDKVKALEQKYGFRSVCYGHAGDGNLHVNILKEDLSDQKWNEELPEAIRELFTFVLEKGGTLSGEHGIGLVQRPYMPLAFSATELSLMRGIKDLFDPKGILNPGKIFPEGEEA